MHAITINERRSHRFEEERRRVYGRIWREEVEGRNNVIIFNLKKEKKEEKRKPNDKS